MPQSHHDIQNSRVRLQSRGSEDVDILYELKLNQTR